MQVAGSSEKLVVDLQPFVAKALPKPRKGKGKASEELTPDPSTLEESHEDRKSAGVV